MGKTWLQFLMCCILSSQIKLNHVVALVNNSHG